jgi:hypothetical protein
MASIPGRVTFWLVPAVLVAFPLWAACAAKSGASGPTGPVSVTLAPASDTLFTRQGRQLTLHVANADDPAVSWTIEPAQCGTVDATAWYVAPATPAVCTVRATSLADRTKSAASVLTIVSVPISTAPLGVNLAGIADYEVQHFFADVVKQGRPWCRVGDPNTPVPVDADGWPTGDAQMLCITGDPQPGTNGTYKLSFTGNATVGLDTPLPRAGGSCTVTNRVYDPGTHTTTADVNIQSCKNVWLTFTGQAGGVKNVKLMRPGHPPGDLFSRDLVARIAPFRALRFMQWAGPPSRGVNGNCDRTWSQRTLPKHAFSNAGAGATYFSPPTATTNRSPAWEWIVLLANQAHKDVWLTLPFFVDDEYVTKLAQLFKYGSDGVNPYTSPQASPEYPPLDSSLRLYVEYCNELWNDTYLTSEVNYNSIPMPWAANTAYNVGWSQTGQRVKVGTGAGANVYELTAVNGKTTGFVEGTSGSLAPSGTTTAQDGPLTWTWRGTVGSLIGWEYARDLDHRAGNRWERGWRKVGYQAVRHSLLFRSVFGDAEMMTRVRPVLAAQIARYATITMPLDYISSVWGGNAGQLNSFGNVAHPVSYYLYGIAGAPYVPTGNSNLDPSSVDALFAGILASLSSTSPSAPRPSITNLGATAGTYGIKALGYEGGQNLIPDLMPGGATATALATGQAAQLDPRMESQVLTPLLHHWYSTANADLFMYYSLSTGWNAYGYWGLSNDITSEATPKWDAVKRIAAGP